MLFSGGGEPPRSASSAFPQNQVVPGLERPLSLNPVENKTHSECQHRGQPRPPRDLHCRKKTARQAPSRNRSVIRCPIFIEGHLQSRAIRWIANAAPAGFATGEATFFPARSGRQSMRGACPANRGYPRSDSVLGVTRHRSDLPLVKRAGLDQSKQPRTAIEAEFVERVARGHGIKAPLPFEYDLNSGQRTFFFD